MKTNSVDSAAGVTSTATPSAGADAYCDEHEFSDLQRVIADDAWLAGYRAAQAKHVTICQDHMQFCIRMGGGEKARTCATLIDMIVADQ